MQQSPVQILRETIAHLEGQPLSMQDVHSRAINDREASLHVRSHELTPGTLMEVQPACYRDRVAALGNALALLVSFSQKNEGPILWCQLREPERLHLHAPGLTAYGLDPKRITKVTLASERDLLWVMEEAIASGSVATVCGVLWSEKLYGFTESKRLRLRARETNTPVLMVRSHRANGTTAADQRVVVRASSGIGGQKHQGSFGLMGHPTWHLKLTKARGNHLGNHHVVWNTEALRLDLASELANRKVKPRGTRQVRPEPISAAG
jgi:protein ImuA